MIVDGFNAVLRALVSGYARLFDSLPPLAGLAIASALLGFGMLWVVGKTSNQQAIERAKKRMQAHLLEMRLYRDEPGLLFRAQGQLIANNFRYVGEMLRPALVLTLPMVVLYAHFDSVYGLRPLRVGESALVTAATELAGTELALRGSDKFAVEGSSVSVEATNEVVWRIRALAAGASEIQLETPVGPIPKTAVAGDGETYLSRGRARSWWQRLLLVPGEDRHDVTGVARVDIGYPSRQVGFDGWETHWAIWFLGISIVTAFLCRGLLGVTI